MVVALFISTLVKAVCRLSIPNSNNGEREQRLIQQFTKMVNKYIKTIATDLNINKQVTSYFARHSYATILRNSGAPTAFISESLGHSNIKTTASYLDSFETDTKKEWAKALVDVSSILQD
jgi:site-specific recombinase XerD